MSKAHDFPQIYKELGYDLAKLGCIMLDLEPVRINVGEDMLYYAKDKAKFWIDGNVSSKTPHATLLYGLLRSGLELKQHVDAVLNGVSLETVTIDHIGFFESPYEDEQYYCIVAHLQLTDELREANDRLKFLPHIDTFPGYKAHFTLAYIKKDQDYRNELIESLDHLHGKVIDAKGLNYGGDK